jgi:histidinol-phosphate aminotransferase
MEKYLGMKPWLKKVNRLEPIIINRSKFLRLDKNERVINFEKKFLNYLKKKINSYFVSAYPEISKIKKLISKKINVNRNNIFISAGSDLSIKTCFELFTKKNDRVITLSPTFGMVEVYCGLYNLKQIKINYDKNLRLNYKKLFKNISKKISLIVLANPNSPTGTIIDHKIMLEILLKAKKFNIPIVIDEAYEGFYKISYIKYTNRFKNLIIIRTFSKSFGLAGLRAGYAVGSKLNMNLMNKYRPMYEINSISCLAIEFLLKNISIVKKNINEIERSKKFLIRNLTKYKINYINTYANFFHIELGKNIKKFEEMFKKKGILFRKGPGVKGFEKFSRFGLGSVKQMRKVLKLVKNVHKKN